MTYITDLYEPDNDLCVTSGVYDGHLYAVPYCASGSLLLYDPNAALGLSSEQLTASAGTADEFKKGKAISCVCDIRAAGDLYRAGLTGNAPYFEAEPHENAESTLVQYLGISRDIEGYKLKYALGLIGFLTTEKAQSKLCDIGLMPMLIGAHTSYDQPWLTELSSRFDPYSIEACFGFIRR